MSACIFYDPEGYTTSKKHLMGRNAAGESFIRAFFEYTKSTGNLWAQCEREEHFTHFEEYARSFNRSDTINRISKSNIHLMETPGLLYIPGPGIGAHSYIRRIFGDMRWSLCGITHTTSSMSAMDLIAELPIAPTQPWDALICTSSAVKSNVEVILREQADYLSDRLGARKIVLPQLPVIPLGIHTDDFSFTKSQRENARREITDDSDTLIVLYSGRLSFHAKAHPLQMYQALEKAASISGKKVHLVECGWHANEPIKNAFSEARISVSPSIQWTYLDGRVQEQRNLAWACADIFCALSDNIQETFGIVPIEAMAAGLPVIVSDWDGYRDTVRDGIDGFRIPTIAPASGMAGDLASRHALGIDSYDMYCGHASSLVAVDSDKLVSAFLKLFDSEDLRKNFGERGRTRARQEYDWGKIIPLYESLWDNLRAIREGQNLDRTATYSWPARIDPTIGFKEYPTQQLTLDTMFKLHTTSAAEAISEFHSYYQLAMVNYEKYIVPTIEELEIIFTTIEDEVRNGKRYAKASTLISKIEEDRKPYVLRGLIWLIKLGLLKIQ